MPPSQDVAYNARTTTCVLNPLNIGTILAHREKKGQEEFLVRWKPQPKQPQADAVCSWHGLNELWRCLHFVQTYVETKGLSAPVSNRKRKSPGTDVPLSSRDVATGILTPQASTNRSRSGSVITISSEEGEDEGKALGDAVSVYNGVLERKEGWIVAKQSKRASKIDATTLPTQAMIKSSPRSLPQAECAIRDAFNTKLQKLPKLFLENNVDTTTPSLNFKFIREYVLGEDVYRAPPEAFEGCQKPCRPNMGQNIGCEYTSCTCLGYAAVDEKSFERQDPSGYQQYIQQKIEQKDGGFVVDVTGLPKRFPYHKKRDDWAPQTLQHFYRESRHPIYECNVNCRCGPKCKSRVVQKGRKVPLTIFKTPNNRGWGVKCNEDLIAGEFIDTYLGEVITNEETDRREANGSHDKASYLYSLDKFIDDVPDITSENCYVVDGQYMGGATRFINHCCEPNCRQFTVSYNKHDMRIYDLAFFAIEDIPSGTELTFDYMDKNEEEEDVALSKKLEAEADPENAGKPRCGCGARKCRGFLWL